jgi:hypothetical protein
VTSYDELVERERQIRDVLARGGEQQLRSLEGVVHVSVGLRERGGAVTDDHAIRVYVRQKLPLEQLAPAERIPAEIDGIPTDVNVVSEFVFATDNTRYRPLLGGIQITNRIIDMNDTMTGTQLARGTLGCFATRISDGSQVLLSNWHVLAAGGGHNGDRIYQPAPTSIPPVDLADLPLRPQDGDDAIGKIVQTVINNTVDCGIARLDLSSWCRSCGLDFHDEINAISVGGHPPGNGIVGQRAAAGGMNVFKVGQHTGRTAGRVVDPHAHSFTITEGGVNYTFDGQILISSTDANPFSRRGDSGSAIIDQDGYIVGLLFSGNKLNPPQDRTMANHIEDVCSALGIRINLASGGGHAGARIAVPSAVLAEPNLGHEAYQAAHERLRAEPAGRWLLDTVERHRVELVTLVNRTRPVTVAWHRAQGPAFLATALNELRAGGDSLPLEVNEQRLDAALERMGAVLSTHGSPALRADIEEHGPPLLAALRASSTLDELLAALDAAGVVPVA